MSKQKCPSCQKEVDYYELECDEPFTIRSLRGM